MCSFSFFLNLLAELELIMSFGKSFQIFIYLYQKEFLRIFVRAYGVQILTLLVDLVRLLEKVK